MVQKLAGPVVVQKGGADSICDGGATVACSLQGSLRRAGGQARRVVPRPLTETRSPMAAVQSTPGS